MDNPIENLLQSEDVQLKKLQQIVQQAVNEEQLIVENLLHEPKEVISPGDSISDKVAEFGGSWLFIITFSIVLSVWALFNTLGPDRLHFDPYPFILMNLFLSAIAALQAPIIMMSQNRKEEKDRKRSENDYLINLKAELELRSLHQKIDLLLEQQIKILFESQAAQLEILKNIETRLSAHESGQSSDKME
ncbi:DUF1003 domain-containing protein [Flavobacterium sp. CYK-4]|uniref:DUF1003 domain-containing protein n=1 Tax=Flavobacterium lotistagni TaxID=2709660 RepID=UPI0014079D54|nr:DUF1003 domain-containing protein [Flavobacterium lotistagni]NHM07545.1 DUF1003 domain-containing protein [Flavobacterium lotistagni]